MNRLFIGYMLSKESDHSIRRIIEKYNNKQILNKKLLIPKSRLHITFNFFGNLPIDLFNFDFKLELPKKLFIKKIDVFSNRVIWLGLNYDFDKEFKILNNILVKQKIIKNKDINKTQENKFKSHITIFRLKFKHNKLINKQYENNKYKFNFKNINNLINEINLKLLNKEIIFDEFGLFNSIDFGKKYELIKRYN